MFSLRRTMPLVLLLFLVFATHGPAQPSDLAARRTQLRDALEQEWQHTLRTSPETATAIGDPRYNDRWGDYSAAEQERQTEHARQETRVFEAIDTTGFPEQEVLNKTLMLRQLHEAVESAPFKDWEMPVDQMNGIQLGLPGLMTQMPLKTVKDYENYVARLHGIAHVLDQVTANMRQGMADHLMPPRYLLEKSPRSPRTSRPSRWRAVLSPSRCRSSPGTWRRRIERGSRRRFRGRFKRKSILRMRSLRRL
jgi:uncharacterized protein (DUF885 family)